MNTNSNTNNNVLRQGSKALTLPVLLLFITFALVLVFAYTYHKKTQWKSISQLFSKPGYIISINYPAENWIAESQDNVYAPGYYDYGAYILLTNKENKDIQIQLEYSYSNNGDDTPVNISETGAPPWPPQPEDLMEDFDPDKFIYLGRYLGKELYADKYPNETGYAGVVQKLSNGKIAGLMPLLSKDKERVNYYDSFHISASYGYDTPQIQREQLHKEFLQILKTLKIEKVK